MSCAVCCLPNYAARSFPRSMAEELTDFALWLTRAMERQGIVKQTALAAASGVAQSTISSYLSGSRTPESPGQVEKLVRALSPPDADEHTSSHLLNTGLRAAGLAPVDDNIVYIPNPAERTLLERYSNSDEAGRRLIDETAEMAAERAALRASRAGAVGGRAED